MSIARSSLEKIRVIARTNSTAMPVRQCITSTPFLTAASLAAFLLAGVLAVAFNSLKIFLLVVGLTFLPLFAVLYPLLLVAMFLFFDLLFPKLPLIPIQGYMVPIRIEDVFLGCALVCLLLRYLIFREQPAPNPLRRWMVIFCAATGISFLFGLFVLRTVPEAKIGFLFWLRTPEYFAASYLCLMGVRTWKQYRAIIIALGSFVVLIGFYGILQECGLVPIFNAMHLTNEIVVIGFSPGFAEDRLFSTFAGPYDLAAFYLLAIPIFMALLFVTSRRIARLAIATLLGLTFFCFYLTFARAPLVALVPVLAICLWLLGKRVWALLIGPLCFFPALLFGGFLERIRYAADDPLAYNSLGGRIVGNWAEALSAAARSPLLGTGPASLGEGMGVDGMYLLLLGMWGVAGLVCFLVLIAKTLHLQWSCVRISSNKLQRALAIGLFAGTVGLLVNAVTLDSLFISKVAFAYWFLTGLLLAGRRLEGRTVAEEGAPAGRVWVNPLGLPRIGPTPPAISGA